MSTNKTVVKLATKEFNPKQTDTFNSMLSLVGKSITAVRSDIQSLVVIALANFKFNGATTKLNKLMSMAIKGDTIRVKTLLGYIKDFAPVTFKENKKGQLVFTTQKGKKYYDTTVPMSSSPKWLNWGKSSSDEVKPMDVLGQLKSLLGRINNGLGGEDGKSVKDLTQANLIKDAITSTVSTIEANTSPSAVVGAA